MSTYRTVMIPRTGGPDVLDIVDLPLREPAPGEVRVRVRATGIGQTDVLVRYGRYLFAPKPPVVPGYEIVGDVDAIGSGVTGVAVGQRVAALLAHGGNAEYCYRPADDLVPVPDGLDAAEAAALVLDYVTAYQMLHREARAAAGQRIVVTAAAGAVGTALIQLGRIAELASIYAVASAAKHDVVAAAGAIPVDYRDRDFAAEIRAREPNGVDAVFDAIGGGDWMRRCRALVRRGGTLVCFGTTGSVRNGRVRRGAIIWNFLRAKLLGLLPGKRTTFYGVTGLYRKNKQPFRDDLAALFALLANRKIAPRIAERIRLDRSDVRRAHELLEAGRVTGKIIIVPT
jgi:NADPH:quinone reductase-like Zn-dependent oxidoreductase